MQRVVALLRGINVGGSNVLTMAELRSVLESLHLTGVRTYLQSGNAVFDTDSEVGSLAPRIQMAIRAHSGVSPDVVTITAPDLETSMVANPFPEANEAPTKVHLFFTVESPRRPDLEMLEAVCSDGERFELVGGVLYLYTPNGFGRSRAAARIEQALGVVATARNWRTVTRLADMACG